MKRATLAFIVFMVVAVAVLGFTADYWHNRFTRAEKARQKAVNLADTRQQTIDDMTLRQRQNAALDAKYTKNTPVRSWSEKFTPGITLQRHSRLQLHAVCMPAATRDTTATGSTDATAARLTPDAERDYQHLRAEAKAVVAQVNGLQQYITEQCH
ncbi:lysis protein [Escherichia coli]|nr:lysis protein [Escherichia coli]